MVPKDWNLNMYSIAGSNSSYWEKKRSNSRGYKLPDHLFLSNAVSIAEEELRRLFYVSITRAEKNLVVSYAKQREDGKELEASQFVEEIKSLQSLEEVVVVPDEATIKAFNLVRLTSPLQPVIEKLDDDIIDKALEKIFHECNCLEQLFEMPS